MPLSDHEQRVLEQLERQLHADDPRLATRLAEPARPGVPVQRLVAGLALVLVGLVVVVTGVSTRIILIGVLGTLLVGAGILVATMRGRGGQGDPSAPRAGGKGEGRRRAAGSGSFMSRLEQGWDERGRTDV